MSSIFGVIGDAKLNNIDQMQNVLTHRGTKLKSKFKSDVAILSVFSHEKHQEPLSGVYESGENFLAFSGSLFFAPEDVSNLKDLYDLILKNGIEYINQLSGSFILLFKTSQKTIICRDPAGESTIVYSTFSGQVAFASEAKAILSLPGFKREIDRGSLTRYFAYSFLPGKATMLKNIFELPAGVVLEIDSSGRTNLKKISTVDQIEEDVDMSLDESVSEFHQLFLKCIEDRYPSDSVGLFLSGGLDSTIVGAGLRELGHSFKSYSLYFGKKYNHELEFAKSAADLMNVENIPFSLEPKTFLPNLREAIWYLDDPIGDPITIPNYELSKFASKEFNYIYNGEGGDPLFGGPKNIPMMLHHWYGYEREENFREKKYLESYRRAYSEIESLINPDFLKDLDVEEELEAPLRPYFSSSRPHKFLNKLMLINIRLKGAHLILPKIKRMQGANGILPLSPLFDSRLIEFSFRIPTSHKLQNGIEKLILKEAYKGKIPEGIIQRPKSGMRVPVHYWFQKELRRYAKSIFNKKDVENAGIFQYKRIKELLSYDLESIQNRYGLKLWMLLTFEIWRKLNIEKESL
ncbi:MAG: hypothetical protein COA79_04030 [Planctomycetota bacterium]|nr:MAG: hypothetical protein COA79_04030 [Planctomycetota bacterium]